ncbi:cytosine permease [Pseudonocardia eucalypti]|uniref:Cytosine permease n=1 Tax=Pseudonocardia eucalypti TaxID=648755 RepID=A0ABP9QTN2_9PSEU|nr:NCS1 family nucleobase:cation symporter-1 [Pseudonocardia eucalypti]
MTSPEQAPLLERHTIGYVPPTERHGRVRDLFTLWFGTNIAPLPIVTGALGPALYGLDLWSSLTAIVVGHMVGGVFMALHSAQGPQMGIPQMIQSRGQFGSIGALLVVAIAGVMYVGFFASNIILAGKSLHGITPAVPLNAGIIIGALGSALICVIGYKLIHILNKIATWVLGLGILAGFVAIVVHGLPADFASRGHFTFAGWLATVALGALWQIAFAPYVSDYSRYLPEDTGVASSSSATYFGCVLGSGLSFAFGAVLALAAPEGTDTMVAAQTLTGGFGAVLLLLFLLSVISHNAFNLYGAVLSLITTVQTFRAGWTPGARARAAVSALVLVVCVIIALGASADFVTQLVHLVLALLIVLVPWTAINLIDYYLIHRGDYDIESIFRLDGGIYGRFNPRALIAYAVGIAVQIPFMNTDVYVGPVVGLVGGADLSWLVGLVITAPLYYLLARRTRAREHSVALSPAG